MTFLALQHKCWRSVGHQVLQPAKDVMFEKLQTGEKIMMHQDSLEPAAIRFTLQHLQESARQSGYFLPAFLCIYIHRNPRKWLIIF